MKKNNSTNDPVLAQLLLRLCRQALPGERITLTGGASQGLSLKLFFFIRILFQSALVCFFISGCQTPTQVSEKDESMETRVFSKIEYGKPVELKRSVIIDVRSRFDHEMSRPPRSFYANPKDWSLVGYQGEALDKKTQELQRLLALKGVDPLTQVVILGSGLSGKGEEFLVASTLLSLGIERIQFLDAKQAKKAMVARNLPKLANAPAWSRPLGYNYNCPESKARGMAQLMSQADIVISRKFIDKGGAPETIFDKSLKLKKAKWPKRIGMKLYSPDSYWAYGLALFLKEQSRRPCVLEGGR